MISLNRPRIGHKLLYVSKIVILIVKFLKEFKVLSNLLILWQTACRWNLSSYLLKKSDKVLRKPPSVHFSRREDVSKKKITRKKPISLHPMLLKITHFNHKHCFLGMLEKVAYTLQKTDCSTYRHCVSAWTYSYWADSLKHDWSLPWRSTPVLDKIGLGQTNEQKRHFNK